MTVMPVTPALITWAREYRGLEPNEAAELLGITTAELLEYEKGKPINLTMFRKISDTFRIPRATLLRRTRPNVPPMPRDFRSIAGRVLDLKRADPPPLKWSDLRYVFDIKEDCNGKEAIQA